MSVIAFGSTVRDKITEFKGIVICRVEHMNRCVSYGVQPPVDNEKQLPDAKFIDEPDLEIVAPPKEDLPPMTKIPNAFKLGVKVKDHLSGFTGVAVLRIKYPYAGDRYGIQATINGKGEIPEIKTFDGSDLEQIDPPPKKKKKEKAKEPPEGPHDRSTAIAR
ncbi:MAG: hypothetical protein PHE52_00725 [Candidatus Pacebacteria bacterium]|nr:hypothetical protein [Candidatus Paceibacterota bacterium]